MHEYIIIFKKCSTHTSCMSTDLPEEIPNICRCKEERANLLPTKSMAAAIPSLSMQIRPPKVLGNPSNSLSQDSLVKVFHVKFALYILYTYTSGIIGFLLNNNTKMSQRKPTYHRYLNYCI